MFRSRGDVTGKPTNKSPLLIGFAKRQRFRNLIIWILAFLILISPIQQEKAHAAVPVVIAACLNIAAVFGAIAGGVYLVDCIVFGREFNWYDFAGHVTAGGLKGMAIFLKALYPPSVLITVLGAADVAGVTGTLGDIIGDFFEECVSSIRENANFVDIKNSITNNLDEFILRFNSTLEALNVANGNAPDNPFEPIWADFKNVSIDNSNLSINTVGMEHNSYEGASWKMLYPGTSYLQAIFNLSEVPTDVILTLTHLTSADSGAPGGGYSPVDIYINGHLYWDNYDVAQSHCGSHWYEIDQWQIAEYLVIGENIITISFEDDPWAFTHYWIQNLSVTCGSLGTAIPNYTITTSASAHGLIEPSGNICLAAGDSKTFYATPDSGYVVDKWYVNGQASVGSEGLGSFTIFNIQQDKTILVTFKVDNSSSGDLIVDRPAVNPYETGDSSVMCSGTAPTNTYIVRWENTTTESNGNTGDPPGTTWAERISLDMGSNSIIFRAYDDSDNLLDSASITVIRLSNIRETDGSNQRNCWISSGHSNFHGTGITFVGYDIDGGYYNERGLVIFDLPSLPFGWTSINNATFGAKTTSGDNTGGGTMGLTVRRITGAWNETSVTWNSQPSYTTSGQTTQNVGNVNNQWFYWDVTNTAQSWYGGSNNYGLFMISQSENNGSNLERVFRNSEYRLTIQYTIETQVPQIQITSPTNDPSYTTGASSVALAGTASDNYQVSHVDYHNQTTGTSGTASGTTSWSCTVPLTAGSNIISVIAYDMCGNADSDTITVFYLTPPATVSATDDIMDYVFVQWEPVTGSGYYRVYRSESETGMKLAVSGWIDGLSFLDTSALPGVLYYYWVTASADSSGTGQSDYAGPAIGKRPAPPNPDLNGDGIVNFFDFAILAYHWLETCSEPDYCEGADYYHDGQVGSNDLSYLCENWLWQDPNTNQPPVLEAIGNKSVSENSLLTFIINATDADGDTLSYSAQNLPSGATFASRTFNWTPNYNQAGTYQVTFRVSDGQATDSETITITVSNTNRSPVLATIGDKSTSENQLLSFVISATDIDGDTLTYSAANRPSGSTFSNRTFSWTPSYTQAGSYQVTFAASDERGGTDSETITITVSNTNRPPVLAAMGNKSTIENQLLSFTVSATDADGDTLTYSAQNLPSGASFANRTFNWTPNSTQVGTYQVTFTVSDGALQDSETITITVLADDVFPPRVVP